jgi:hypothetical protein
MPTPLVGRNAKSWQSPRYVLFMFHEYLMANWSVYLHVPSPKQFDEMVRKRAEQSPAETDDSRWISLLNDPRATGTPGLPIRQCRLNEILRYILRVSCYDVSALWKSRRWTRCACTFGKMSDRNC